MLRYCDFDLQLGLAEVADHPLAVNAQELSNLDAVGLAKQMKIRWIDICVRKFLGFFDLVLDLSLLLLADRHKVLGHVAHVHHAGGVLEHVVPDGRLIDYRND